MIEVKELTKLYGNNKALDGISFNIQKGKIYGFLGQNGAGKSTTMNIITGCLAATEGSVTINGYDITKAPTEAKRHIGYLPEIPPLYPEMAVSEYLSFIAEAKGVDSEQIYTSVNSVMSLTDISGVANRLIKHLSKGYKQRVGIAQALLGDPDIIILDEPTVGLDPKQIKEIRALIKALGTDRTVIISSHILTEISEICDHVIIISAGKIVADAPIHGLDSSVNGMSRLTLHVKCDADTAADILDTIPSVKNYIEEWSIKNESRFNIEFLSTCDPAEEIFYAFADKREAILDMSHIHLSLEDIFLSFTEHDTRMVNGHIIKSRESEDI